MNNGFGKRWALAVTSKPFIFIFLSILVGLGIGSGGRFLKFSSDYRYFFGKDNPQRLAFEKLQNVYDKDDSVLFTVTPKDGKVFKAETLKAIHFLTQAGWKVPFSTRVDSITNFQYSKAIEDDLIVKDLVKEEELNKGETFFEEVKEIALNEPLLAKRLINEKATVTAVNVRLHFPGKDMQEVPKVAKHSRDLVKKFKAQFPGHEVHLSGVAMMNNAFNEAGMNDMATLTPAMYGVILFIMLIMLRSISAVGATLGVIILSVMTGMGAAGFFGIPLTPPSAIAPTVIVTLAIADSIHILKSILAFLREGMSKRDAIVEGLRINFRAVFLTSFTTIIGFLSLNFSDTPPFHDLGNITSAGVLGAFLYSTVFLPAALIVLPLKAPKPIFKEKEWSEKYSNWLSTHKTQVFFVTLFSTIFLFLQIPKINLNDQFVNYFSKSIQFRTDTEYTMNNLTGIYQINFDLKSGEDQGVSDPKFLQRVEDFSNYVRGLPGVTHVSTITDTFKRLNKNLHGDDQTYYKLPESRELGAQYLLLYEMSLPYGLDLNNQINVDKSSTRIVVTLGNLETSEVLAVGNKAEEWLKNYTPKVMHTLGTSPVVMFSHISKRNVIAMFWGTLLAFGLITLTLVISLKSVKYGIISLLPNLIPAGMAFGVWSLLVGEAGFSIAVVASVTLGIVVDDTVHFLSKYALARQEKNLSARDAVNFSFSHVGGALVTTSIILAIGFSILMLSNFKMNFDLGALSALTIILAVVVDFTFLPALLGFVDEKKVKIGGNLKTKHIMTTIFVTGMAFFLSSLVSYEAQAMTPQEKGLWVAKEIDKRDNGFVNQTSNATMILRNKQGQESTRKMRIKSLEVQGDGDKSLTIFDSPRDVKGTAFLSFSHATTPDDQWLYLPALRRVKRISSNNKSGPFMGSEFAYEDISSQEVNKYTYKHIKEDKVSGESGHILERYPVDKNSGYTKQIVWVDAKEWRVHKIQFFDRKGELLKTLAMKGYKKYSNDKWRADEFHMENHQNGKSTKLIWKNIKFNQNISSRDFDRNALKRIR